MSSACFEPEGSYSGRRMCVQVWYSVLYMHQYRAHTSTCNTAYSDACKTRCTIPVYKTVFLKMNSRVRNM